jgi:leucyl aminopeptidase
VLASLAIKSGDLEAKPGKLLSAYRTPGIAATRVVLAGVGRCERQERPCRCQCGLGCAEGQQRAAPDLCFSTLDGVQPEAVRAAVTACSDATYTYTTTKSKASPAKLRHVVIAVMTPRAPRRPGRPRQRRGAGQGC